MLILAKGRLSTHSGRHAFPTADVDRLSGNRCLTLWLTGARKEAKSTEARPVEPRVGPDR
jgi:hypothetical protein